MFTNFRASFIIELCHRQKEKKTTNENETTIIESIDQQTLKDVWDANKHLISKVREYNQFVLLYSLHHFKWNQIIGWQGKGGKVVFRIPRVEIASAFENNDLFEYKELT